jgi:predicted alpha/beta hydrolase family esterase
MSKAMQTTILMVPGLRGDMPDHWQSILQGELPKAACVPRIGTENLSCAAWVKALDDTLAGIQGPVILAAHSAGCLMTVHWAQSHRRPIRGALLAAPADLETPMPAPYPPIEKLRDNGWLPMPRVKLAFPSIVAASSNDPLSSIARAQELAASWGSRFVDIGPAGHLNPVAGYGPWPRAHDFLRELDAVAA